MCRRSRATPSRRETSRPHGRTGCSLGPASDQKSDGVRKSKRRASARSGRFRVRRWVGMGLRMLSRRRLQLHRDTGQATFKGNARLWQQGNSISAPVIVLDRTKQTLTAETTSAAEPVQVVLVSAGGDVAGKAVSDKQLAKPTTPSVIRVRGGDLRYSSAERKAVMHAGRREAWLASTADANTSSKEDWS